MANASTRSEPTSPGKASSPVLKAQREKFSNTQALLDLAEILTEPSVSREVVSRAAMCICLWQGWTGAEVWITVGRALERVACWFEDEAMVPALGNATDVVEFEQGIGVLGRANTEPASVTYPSHAIAKRAREVEKTVGLRQVLAAPLSSAGASGVITFYAEGPPVDVQVPETLGRALALLGRGLSRFVRDTNQDVIERRLAMQAQVLMHISEGVSLTDADGTVIYANEAMGRLINQPAGSMVGRHVTEFCDSTRELCLKRHNEMWQQLRHTSEWRGEISRELNGGTLYTVVHARGIVLNGVSYALAVHSEITDLKCEQMELETARQRLEHLLTANPAIIYTRSARDPRVITFISDDLRTRFGYEPTQFLNRSDFWMSHIHPEDAGRILVEASEAVGQEAGSFEYRFLHGDGRYRWIHDEYKIVPGKAGGVEFIGCWVDISEIKETEFMLERQTRRLAKSNRELEQFAYVASHDLRAPLRAIDTLSEWLEHDLAPILNAESKQQMTLLRGRVRRMDRLLADLLEYSRIGRVNVPPEMVDAAELIHEVEDLSQLNHTLEIRLDGPMPKFVTARLPFKRVFMNLLTNAAKHHDKPKGCVTVRCVECEDYFEFALSDDGPGIPEQYHERVFQMFQTLKPRDASEGSGMGLSLVRRIVESAGGRLALESKGRGATFRFTWPRAWRDVPPASSSLPLLTQAAPVRRKDRLVGDAS